MSGIIEIVDQVIRETNGSEIDRQRLIARLEADQHVINTRPGDEAIAILSARLHSRRKEAHWTSSCKCMN